MASGKSKTSFCIDSLLAQDKTSVKNSSSSPLPLTTSSSLLPSAHEHFLLGSYGDSIRFRSNLFGGLQHHQHFQMFEPPPLISAGSSGSQKSQVESDLKQQHQTDVSEVLTAEDRPQSSSSSSKEENGASSSSTVVAAGEGQHKSDSTCWQQPYSVNRMAYGPVSTASGTTPTGTTSSTMTSSATSPTSVNYPGQLFGSQAAALHAAAAAAAAVAASSPSAHQFHSAHLEWLARAGVLYHRFGGDLAGQLLCLLTCVPCFFSLLKFSLVRVA